MDNKRFIYLAMVFLLLFGGKVAQVSGQTDAFFNPLHGSTLNGSVPENPSGQSRKVFYYERTFGETEVAFLADTAHIYNSEGVGVDSEGNLWVAETLGARLLKYSGDGKFLMKIGTAGKVWLADNKHISVPIDVAVDSSNNTWAVDQNSHRVVKFDANGNFLMQLGVTWEAESDNAHLDCPFGIAFNSAGDIYVSDTCNLRIQVFDSDGEYNTTIGETDVPGSDNAHFGSPWRIAIDEDDNLYVADLGNERVQIFDSSHNYIATLGVTGVIGDDEKHFNNPRGVAVGADYIYVADGGNHRVQIFDRTTGDYWKTLSTGGGSGTYEFNWPGDVAVDSAGNIYVADELNSRVQKFDSSLTYSRTFGTTDVPYLTDGYHYYMPYGVAVDSAGDLGIVEDNRRGHRFIKLDASGVPQLTIGVPGVTGSDEAHFANPRGVAFDADGNIYVCEEWNHRIQIFSSDGTYQTTLGTGWGTGLYQFKYPDGVAVDDSGNIYVADSDNHRVQIYNNNLSFVTTLGVTGISGEDNKHFNWPNDVAVDANGNIYVADTSNHRVQIFNSNRIWQKTVGDNYLWEPRGVAVDLVGNIYVADTVNNRVQVFDGKGTFMLTIGGSWGNRIDQFRHPQGVDVDLEGNVYIADMYNHRIQKYVPGTLVFLPVVGRSQP